jgi:glycosyltransferase involved in cell wall biosynthesis
MSKQPILSIITITFNNFEELIRTIESVKDLKGCEHVVINGGTCQKTLEFLKSYCGKSFSEPDQGISDAFNKGIKYSKGDTVMMLNSGDILLDQSYPEQAMKILNENPEVDFVHADELYDDVLIGKFVMQPLRFQNNLKPNIGRGMPYRHQTMVVRKTVYDRVGWFDLSYISSDYDWVCRWEVSLFNSDRSAYYLKGNPVVKMDGAGVSATQESKVMWEAIQIIKRNFPNKIEVYLTFLKRLILFSGRKLLKWLGQENYLSTLKLRKYNNKWSDK